MQGTKTKVEYNVCMQISPILPIVYYEGFKKWTVPLNFRSHITEGMPLPIHL